MIELKDWVKAQRFDEKPWLLLGKGPTFSRRSEFDLRQFHTFSLNHVVREEKVEVAHIIDIDVVDACKDKLLDNCRWLIMPRIPNVKCQPSEYLNINDWLKVIPVLAKAEEMGRLIVYDFSHEPVPNEPWTIDALYFSSEIGMGILGRMGVKSVKTIGVDGGRTYSTAFGDLQQNTLLINGQPNFDRQFGRLADLAKKFEITFERLIEPESIPGSDEGTKNGADSVADIEEPEFASLERAQKYAADYHYAREPGERSDLSKDSSLDLPDKIETMEEDLRSFRSRFEEAREELAQVSIDLAVAAQRLAWARQEVKEYKAEVIRVNSSLHKMVSSVTWKVGRALTKPGQILRPKKRQGSP